MKKTFLAISALAAMLFAGCTSSDELTTLESIKTADNTPTPVQFGTYMSNAKNTRTAGPATELTSSNLKSFGVFAFHSDGAQIAAGAIPNFMFNQKVSGGTGSYTYTPVKYWPNHDGVSTNGSESDTDYLSFYAYAPYGGLNDGTNASTETANGISLTDATTTYANNTPWGTGSGQHYPKIYYDPTVSSFTDNYTNNIDILYAVAQENLTKPNLATTTTPGVVTLHFKHAMAKIGETVNVRYLLNKSNTGGTTGDEVATETSVILKEVEIWIEGAADEILTKGWLDLKAGTWSPGADGYNAAIASFSDANTAKLAMSKTTTGFGGLTDDKVTNANTKLTDFTGFLMIPANGKEITIKARAKYNVVTADAALNGGNSTVENNITQSVNVTLVPNKKYTINLVLGLEEVKLEAVVDSWDNNTPSSEEIDLPSNTVTP